MIGLALRLQKVGHTVAFICDMSCEGLLNEQGLARIPRGDIDGHSFLIKKWAEPVFCAIQAKHTQYALSQFSADLIVTQPLAMGCIFVAKKAQIKHATIGFFSPLWLDKTYSQVSNIDTSLCNLRKWRAQNLLDLYNRFCRYLGINESQYVTHSNELLGDAHLVRNYSEHLSAHLPKNYFVIGSMLWEEEPDEVIRNWVADAKRKNKKIIYIQHGQRFHQDSFWDQIDGWACNEQFAIAVSFGDFIEDGAIHHKNVLAKPYIPQSFMMKNACFAITNGHTTSVLGAIESGIDMAVFTVKGETVDNGVLCENLPNFYVFDESDSEVPDLSLIIKHRLKDKITPLKRDDFFAATQVIDNLLQN
ncbi:hypothetical protein CJF42_02595 [Pseudoalteromonas sp. NBT06-2]|uniref:hypothetical protein n=1 Tax=Pseudoalteromonas sp. NBT06-2 TaxID=2025950 RepID=UPI000BA5256B|nr:hypothetical protein [Pseudoalteromonas sp. NBT06-2]PAJ75929.1 hypothetical protein CJF42_02595 [Pseudoalteromonas sp. NBT06-2]